MKENYKFEGSHPAMLITKSSPLSTAFCGGGNRVYPLAGKPSHRSISKLPANGYLPGTRFPLPKIAVDNRLEPYCGLDAVNHNIIQVGCGSRRYRIIVSNNRLAQC